jgi:hypothetical protein
MAAFGLFCGGGADPIRLVIARCAGTARTGLSTDIKDDDNDDNHI